MKALTATNQEVAGSSPAGLTLIAFRINDFPSSTLRAVVRMSAWSENRQARFVRSGGMVESARISCRLACSNQCAFSSVRTVNRCGAGAFRAMPCNDAISRASFPWFVEPQPGARFAAIRVSSWVVFTGSWGISRNAVERSARGGANTANPGVNRPARAGTAFDLYRA
jgi:hypothetical protein